MPLRLNSEATFAEQDTAVVAVRDVMTEALITLDSDDSAMEAARVMTHRKVSSILVSGGKEVCGIITDHDIISRVVAQGLDPRVVKVARVMSSPLITIPDNAGIDDAAKKMAEDRVRRLIVERYGEIVGIIGESDIIRIEPELHFLIREQSKLKPKFRPANGRSILLAGYCEECGNYSSQLRKVDGGWLDEDCSA
jgi:signal-transduction protein with cAMP-binding, CBS, and nucleotidyltransferase domain